MKTLNIPRPKGRGFSFRAPSLAGVVVGTELLFALTGAPLAADFAERRLGGLPAGCTLEDDGAVFTGDGTHAAFPVRCGGATKVIFGEIIGKGYSYVRHVAISPDGRSVAHSGAVAEDGGEKVREFRVVNGVEIGPFEQVCNPVFSPDSSTVAFEYKQGGLWRHAASATVGDRIVAETAAADLNWMRPVFSLDGKFVVSIQQHRAKGINTRLVSSADLREVRRREYEAIDNVTYSADGRRTAYRARKNGKALVVTSSFEGGDERESAAYDAVSEPVLNRDGSHLAFGAERMGKSLLVVDGRELPAPFFYERLQPVFSADWKTFAYLAAREGKQYIVFGGKEVPRFDDISPPAMTAAGDLVAYGAATGGKWRLVIGTQVGAQSYDAIDAVRFSADMRQVVFRAMRSGKQQTVVADLNGKVVAEGPLFDRIWEPSFDSRGTAGYGAFDGREIWWKVLDIPEGKK